MSARECICLLDLGSNASVPTRPDNIQCRFSFALKHEQANGRMRRPPTRGTNEMAPFRYTSSPLEKEIGATE